MIQVVVDRANLSYYARTSKYNYFLLVEQTHSSGQAAWAATATPASPPPFGSGDASWTNQPISEPREESECRIFLLEKPQD